MAQEAQEALGAVGGATVVARRDRAGDGRELTLDGGRDAAGRTPHRRVQPRDRALQPKDLTLRLPAASQVVQVMQRSHGKHGSRGV
jgi:hypothetical protein